MSRMGVSSAVMLAAVIMASISMPAVDACNGYQMTIHEVGTKCADGTQSIFTTSPDMNATLTPDCKLIPAGCAEISEGFDSATVKYKITPKMMPTLSDERPLCELLAMAKENQEVVNYMEMFHLPTACPVTAGKICSDEKVVDLSEKNMVMVPGIVTGEVEIIANTGKKACLNFIVELKMG